jgi:hypothetical protein
VSSSERSSSERSGSHATGRRPQGNSGQDYTTILGSKPPHLLTLVTRLHAQESRYPQRTPLLRLSPPLNQGPWAKPMMLDSSVPPPPYPGIRNQESRFMEESKKKFPMILCLLLASLSLYVGEVGFGGRWGMWVFFSLRRVTLGSVYYPHHSLDDTTYPRFSLLVSLS